MMLKTAFPACFRCTVPKHPDEQMNAYRKRAYAYFAKLARTTYGTVCETPGGLPPAAPPPAAAGARVEVAPHLALVAPDEPF